MKIQRLQFFMTLIFIFAFQMQNLYAQTQVTIDGKVYDDANALKDGNVNGLGADTAIVNVVLVNDSTGKVVAVMPSGPNGDFSFDSLSPAPYSVRLTTLNAVVGFLAPMVMLPTNWVSTGEYFGAGAGSDGIINSKLYLDSVQNNISNVKLGIEQRPETNTSSTGYLSNVGGVNFVSVPNTNFSGYDYGAGFIDSIRIVAFPTNTTTFKVNGTNYTAATFPATGIKLKTSTNGVPLGANNIQLDPNDGVFMAKIPYVTLDNGGYEDLSSSLVNVLFSVSDGQTAQELVNSLVGTGVIVLNPQLNGTCPTTARGLFNFFGANDLGIDSGIVLTSGRVVSQPPNGPYGVNGIYYNFATTGFPSSAAYAPGDADLNTLLSNSGSNAVTHDACVLEFDFVPAGDTIKFDYVFGSEEYLEYACTGFNDVFGFFISGSGFTGLTNIAIVPNTNIPVAINSINNLSNPSSLCTSMGTGSPFAQYYVDNIANNGQQIAYDGYTTVLTAKAGVTPCDTYHLKLAIADAGDNAYDSGVFLKAGSLNSTGITVKTFGGAGLETPFTNTVRGCPAGVVRISRNAGFAQSVNIPLQITGTAVNGVDYQAIPTSVTIPAGDTSVSIYVSGIPIFPPVGPKTCIISALSPYNCNGSPLIISSDTITILDSIYVDILNNDTAICYGESVPVSAITDTAVNFQWSPLGSISNANSLNVVVTPDTPTTYRLTVSLPATLGCPPSSDTVRIDVKRQPQVDLGPDIFTCSDTVQLNATTYPPNDDESYLWSPAVGLSNPTIINPVAQLTGSITYVLTVNPGAIGCNGADTLMITLLPDHIDLLNTDTVVCKGTLIQLYVDGDNHFSYNWSPPLGIANDTVKNTTLLALQSGTYTVTASYPTCPAMPDSFYVEVQPIPLVDVGSDLVICDYASVQLLASVMPSNYSQYSYSWASASDLDNPNSKIPVFSGDNTTKKVVAVKTPIGCTGKDSLLITVHKGDFLEMTPSDTGICPPGSVQLNSIGAEEYRWYPADGLNNENIPNPIAKPQTTTLYTLVGKSQANCYDTVTSYIQIYPNAVMTLPDSVEIWFGESYQIEPEGNTLYYSWFPPSGLSADDISNPMASPQVRTRYFVTAKTAYGCVLKDSIDILVNTEAVFEVPNAFTPGSGLNGVFKIEKRGIVNLISFSVYNRWGNKIFETNDINTGWDGSYNGQPQPSGVYVYIIDAKGENGAPIHKVGDVTMIR